MRGRFFPFAGASENAVSYRGIRNAAAISVPRIDEAACADGKAANPAIALLIALLRAKEASNAE